MLEIKVNLLHNYMVSNIHNRGVYVATALPARLLEPGKIIDIEPIQAWAVCDGRLRPYACQFVPDPENKEQVEEAQSTYRMTVQVEAICQDSGVVIEGVELVRIIHCVDGAPQHTLYMHPGEEVQVVGEFNAASNRRGKKSRGRNPVAGARRQ